MKYALRGGTVTAANPLPYEWRIYQLVKITGWTIQQIDDTPAEMIDWILALHATEAEIRAERRRAEDRRWPGGRR